MGKNFANSIPTEIVTKFKGRVGFFMDFFMIHVLNKDARVNAIGGYSQLYEVVKGYFNFVKHPDQIRELYFFFYNA